VNKIDKEIIVILKEIFKPTRVNPLDSDHNVRLWMIRMFFLLSVLVIIGRVIINFSNHQVTNEYSAIANTPIAIFFTLLFLHINNEVEETSLIIFVLTWLALIISLYV